MSTQLPAVSTMSQVFDCHSSADIGAISFSGTASHCNLTSCWAGGVIAAVNLHAGILSGCVFAGCADGGGACGSVVSYTPELNRVEGSIFLDCINGPGSCWGVDGHLVFESCGFERTAFRDRRIGVITIFRCMFDGTVPDFLDNAGECQASAVAISGLGRSRIVADTCPYFERFLRISPSPSPVPSPSRGYSQKRWILLIDFLTMIMACL